MPVTAAACSSSVDYSFVAESLKGVTEAMAKKVIEAFQVKFTAIQIGEFTEDELHQHIQEFVEAEKEKANKGLGALMGGNQVRNEPMCSLAPLPCAPLLCSPLQLYMFGAVLRLAAFCRSQFSSGLSCSLSLCTFFTVLLCCGLRLLCSATCLNWSYQHRWPIHNSLFL